MRWLLYRARYVSLLRQWILLQLTFIIYFPKALGGPWTVIFVKGDWKILDAHRDGSQRIYHLKRYRNCYNIYELEGYLALFCFTSFFIHSSGVERVQPKMSSIYKALAGKSKDNKSEKKQGNVKQFMNKQRTLLISSRGVNYRHRHLIQDLSGLLPHSRKEPKLDTKKDRSGNFSHATL